MTPFTENDDSISSEEWEDDTSTTYDRSSDDEVLDDDEHSSEDEYPVNDYQYDVNEEEDYSMNDIEQEEREAIRYRQCTIAILSSLLMLLLISFSYQLMELYDNNPTSDTKQIHSKTINRILHMLSYNPATTHQQRNYVHNETNFQMPHDSTRIYTHASLTSKNYRAGGILSDDMIDRYERDGVLVLRNLISPKLLERLDLAGEMLIQQAKENGGSKRKGKQFHLVKNGAIFLGVPPFNSDASSTCSKNSEQCALHQSSQDSSVDNTTILSSFRDLAVYSKLPRVAASLLRLDELRVGIDNLNMGSKRSRERSRRRQTQNNTTDTNKTDSNDYVDESINLRIARDIFLTKDNDPYACGWHVDDTGFWPNIAQDIGVNAWIALDDMPWPWSSFNAAEMDRERSPVATFALALGSHRAPWRQEAYHVTGSTHTQPIEGFASAQDLIERRTGSGTCNIQTSAPHLYEKLEERKVVYDLKKGDVIFHDRWVFHRTVTMEEYMQMSGQSKGDGVNDKIFKRYSIRYSPGTSRVPPGYGFELSTLHNPDNANSTMDEIVARDGPFYPQVWPHVVKKKPSDEGYVEEIEGLTELVYEKLPRAEMIQKERKKEVNRLLSARGRPY